jgi:small subunit ribosomal protein S16
LSVKIRLARVGAKGHPSYRVVVADERASRSGNVIEIIGQYNPLVDPVLFKVDRDKVLEWLKKGAVPTFTVRKMLGKAGVLKAIDFSGYKKRAPKQKAAPTGGQAAPAGGQAAPAGGQAAPAGGQAAPAGGQGAKEEKAGEEKAAETPKTEEKPA